MEHPGCKPCWTCRNRHVQCDLSPTPCTKCQKAGLECFEKLPLRWVKGVALRGKMQGHTYENKSENRDFTMKKPKHIRFKSPVVKIGTSRHNGTILPDVTNHLYFCFKRTYHLKSYTDFAWSRCLGRFFCFAHYTTKPITFRLGWSISILFGLLQVFANLGRSVKCWPHVQITSAYAAILLFMTAAKTHSEIWFQSR